MRLVRRSAKVMRGAHIDGSTDKSIDAAHKQIPGAVPGPGANHHFQFTE
jgi:hypothetical protein